MNFLTYLKLRSILSKEEIDTIKLEEKKAFALQAKALIIESAKKEANKIFKVEKTVHNVFKEDDIEEISVPLPPQPMINMNKTPKVPEALF